MIRTTILSAVSALLVTAGSGLAAGVTADIENIKFPFDGPFGKWDQAQLQRGLQVYTESCSACHGLKFVPLRTIGDLGYSEAEVRAFAAQWDVFDPTIDDFRAAKPTDSFPGSQLEDAPDLSLMAKARAGFSGPYALGINQLIKGIGGPEYIAAFLTGYTGEEVEEFGTLLYMNDVFSGGKTSMGPPLFDGGIEFADGHANDVQSQAEDVAAFLMWAAEPKMMVRKQVGFLAVGFLTFLSVLLYFTNRRIWKPIKNPTDV